MINIPEQLFAKIDPTNKLYTALCGTDPTVTNCAEATTGKLLTLWLPNVVIVAGIIFLYRIIRLGWNTILESGLEPNAQDKAKAQSALTYAIVGFLLMVATYFILQIIGIVLGIDFINPKDLTN